MSKEKKDVKQEQQKQEVAVMANAGTPQLPDTMNIDMMAELAGRGTQNMTQKDIATPLLIILQANSPQCKKSDGKFIPGAVEGTILNNVTNELIDGEKGMLVLPCFFEKVFIEWKPNRGGFVGIHDVNSPLRDKVVMTDVKQPDGSSKQLPLLPNGNLLIETNQHYVLMLQEDGSVEPAVIPMVSTALAASRKWNSLMKKVMWQDSKGQMFNPPSFALVYRLTTKGRQRDQYSWSTWSVENIGPVQQRNAFEAALGFERTIASGAVKVKHDIDQSETINGKASEDDEKM